MPISPKLAPLVEYLEVMIACGKFPPGTKLPPLRKLCAEFKISLGLANQALELLVGRGLLEVRHGSGAYVKNGETRHPATAGRTIGVVYQYGAKEWLTYSGYILRGVMDAAEMHPELALKRCYIEDYRWIGAGELERQGEDCDAFIIIGNYDYSCRELPRSRPAVGVELGTDYDGWLSMLTLDPFGMARLSTAYFKERGVHTVRDWRYQNEPLHQLRSELFRREWEAAGGSYEPIAADYAGPQLSPEEEPDILERMRKSPGYRYRLPAEPAPGVGWWFSGSVAFRELNRKYRDEYGRDFSDDHTVLTVDGKNLLIPGYPPSDTITTDWRSLGRAAFDEALRRLVHPGAAARNIFQHGTLQLMESQTS